LNKELFTIILILGIAIVSSLLLITQPVFASPEQEVDNEKQSSGSESQETTDEEEQEVEPQPAEEPQSAEDTPTPNNELPASEQEQQQQLTLDIIKANGLVPVNDTTVADGNGNAGGGTSAREVTCVSNSQGQTFCYEILKPDENCLKPINVEDPPLCKAGQ